MGRPLRCSENENRGQAGREKSQLRKIIDIIDVGSLEQPQKWGPSPSGKEIVSREGVVSKINVNLQLGSRAKPSRSPVSTQRFVDSSK
jgi:hypothetical protein